MHGDGPPAILHTPAASVPSMVPHWQPIKIVSELMYTPSFRDILVYVSKSPIPNAASAGSPYAQVPNPAAIAELGTEFTAATAAAHLGATVGPQLCRPRCGSIGEYAQYGRPAGLGSYLDWYLAHAAAASVVLSVAS